MLENEPRSTIEDVASPQAPVPVAKVATGRRFGVRWVVGLIVVALVVTASIASVRLLAPQSSGSHLAGWAPADSIAYVEARLDLPGDQHDKLASFLAHFPGFAGASLDSRLSETYDRIVRGATDQRHDYSTEIQPWFSGSLALVVTRPAPVNDPNSHSPGALVIAGVKDRTAATAWLSMIINEGTPAATTSTYANADLITAGHGSAAVLGDVLIVGDTQSVKAALDLNGQGGLAAVAAFTAASGAVDPNSLVTYYVDARKYLDYALQSVPSSGAAGLTECVSALNSIPAWYAGTVRAEGNALVSRTVVPHVASAVVTASNGKSTLTSHLPASTLLVVDEHELGAVIRATVDQYRTCTAAGLSSMLDQLDSGVAKLGGWDKLTGWIGETALVIDRDGGDPTGGLLVVPKDRAAADLAALQLRNLLGQAGPNVTVIDETYKGVTLTIISSSPELSSPATAHLAYVVTDQFVAVGLESWVKKVLDTQAGDSLASDARFSSALARVSADHTSLIYANVAGIYGWIEDKLPAATIAQYEGEVGPYLAPLDAIIVTSSAASDMDRFDVAVLVK